MPVAVRIRLGNSVITVKEESRRRIVINAGLRVGREGCQVEVVAAGESVVLRKERLPPDSNMNVEPWSYLYAVFDVGANVLLAKIDAGDVGVDDRV